MKNLFPLLFGLILFCTSPVSAFTPDDLAEALNQIEQGQLDTSAVYSADSIRVHSLDAEIMLYSGDLAFMKLTLDSTEMVYGAYFEGEGSFRFKPPVKMETDQLQRHYKADSIDISFEKIILLFDRSVYETQLASLPLSENSFTKAQLKSAGKLREKLDEDADYLYSFELLQAITHPIDKPFFLTYVKPKRNDEIIYMFNPHLREEIKLQKNYKEIANSFMETIVSYSQYNRDESYRAINGRSKEQLDVKHYLIDAAVDRKGNYISDILMTAIVKSGPLSMAVFNLGPNIHIDSILDNNGKHVTVNRWKLKKSSRDWETRKCGLIFNQPYNYNDSLKLRFFVNGEVALAELGEFYVFAGSDWYPRYGYRQRAIFDLTFKTDNSYQMVVSGKLMERKTNKDTLITAWKVLPAAANVSFNIGYMKKYMFEPEDVLPVQVYYSRLLHQRFVELLTTTATGVGKNMEEQVAEDVINSIRVYNHYFGETNREKLTVTENIATHGEAFPGMINLGFDTWMNTDPYGNDRMLRSHEVAHQWWGIGVGYETYHDKWLSEGLATYSSLMYLQKIEGNDMFFDKLKEFRNQIFSARKYILGSGAEAGPIALGYRTSSTETAGDFGLIVYKKGAFVLHMLRNILIDFTTMNEDKFFDLLKEFYHRYRGKDANTAQFQAMVEKYIGGKMDWFFRQWVYGNDLPEYEFTYEVESIATQGYNIKGRILAENVSDDFMMYIPLQIEFENGKSAYVRLLVDSKNYQFTLPKLAARPKKITLNPFQSVLAKVNQ